MYIYERIIHTDSTIIGGLLPCGSRAHPLVTWISYTLEPLGDKQQSRTVTKKKRVHFQHRRPRAPYTSLITTDKNIVYVINHFVEAKPSGRVVNIVRIINILVLLRPFSWAGSVGTSLASQKFHLNTASFYYLLDLSSFSSLSPLFLYYFRFLFFFVLCFLIFVVPSLFIRKAGRQQLIRIFPSMIYGWHSALWRAAVQTMQYLVWTSVWLTWPKTAVSLLSLQPRVPRFKKNSLVCFLHPSTSSKHYCST